MTRRVIKSEQGFTLPLALGILVVLAILLIAIVDYSSANSRNAYTSNNRQNAYTAALAGLDNAMSTIRSSDTPRWPGLLPATTKTYNGGTVTWSGTLDQSNPNVGCPGHLGCWMLTSTGQASNPTGGGSHVVSRTLTVRVPLDAIYTQPLVNPVYDYVFVYGTNNPSGCDFSNNNNSLFGSRLYVQGNLCISNNTQITNELNVWGHATLTNPATIGVKSGNTITYDTAGVHIVGGCSTSLTGPWTAANCATPANNPPGPVYANPVADTSPTTLTPPDVVGSAQGWYKDASPGPYSPCTTSSGTPSNTGSWLTAFDNDVPANSAPNSVYMNRSVPGAFDLTPPTAYSCVTPYGELSWDPNATDANNIPVPTLRVKGTIFIDGNARIAPTNIQVIRYVGEGSIYLSGSIVVKSTHICAVYIVSGGKATDCDWALPGTGHWDVAQNFLDIVAGVIGGGGQTETPNANTSVELQSAFYQGAMTARLNTDIGSATTTQGPLVQTSMTLGQALTTKPFGTLTDVPTATPGNRISAIKVLAPTNYSG